MSSRKFRALKLLGRGSVVAVAREQRESGAANAHFDGVVVLARVGVRGQIAEGVLVAGLLGRPGVEVRTAPNRCAA